MKPSCKIWIMILLAGLTEIALDSIAMAQTATLKNFTGSGHVRIQRARNTGWQPVRKGKAFRQDDQLRTDRGVTAYIKCPGSKTAKSVRAFRPKGLGSICFVWSNSDWKGTQSASTLGGIDSNIPYLITPRHTLLLNPTPLLRWNPVSETTQYTVVVTGPAGEIWRTQTPKSELVYAGPTLTPGVSYRVTVTTNMGQSSQADSAPNGNRATDLDFRLLHPSEAKIILDATDKIAADPTTDVADALAVARLYGDFTLPADVISTYDLAEDTYQTYSLTMEAIALLETTLKQNDPSPLLHRTLGDLYWQTGLIQQAADQYHQAIRLTASLADLEDWTLSHFLLAKIYNIKKDYPRALQSYQQARVGYGFLGNERLAQLMQRRVDKLEKKLNTLPDL